MSDSYKKAPVVKTYNLFTVMAKKQSNKRIRQSKHISCGANYKKLYPQWKICEQRSYIKDSDFAPEEVQKFKRK